LITILPKPVAAFPAIELIRAGVPAAIQFTKSTAGAVNGTWDFGDGSTSTAANPQHVYNTFGLYTVKLIVTGANGCTDTLVKKNLFALNSLRCSLQHAAKRMFAIYCSFRR